MPNDTRTLPQEKPVQVASKSESGGLFQREESVLARAQAVLDEPGTDDPAILREEMALLAKGYRKLLRQTERLTRISDRRQNKYYRVSNDLEFHLERHVGEAIKDEILKAPLSVERVRMRELVVAFLDIRGFSSFAESLEPDQVIHFLKSYYEYSLAIVHEHGGLVKCFMGDGVMLVFGFRHPETASDRALACARQLIEHLPRFRERCGWPIQVGIGLHHGPTAVGTIGTDKRAELAVIGSTVNIASRIESMTKQLKLPVLFSESFKNHLKNTEEEIVQAAEVTLRGLTKSSRLYTFEDLLDG